MLYLSADLFCAYRGSNTYVHNPIDLEIEKATHMNIPEDWVYRADNRHTEKDDEIIRKLRGVKIKRFSPISGISYSNQKKRHSISNPQKSYGYKRKSA